MGNKKTSSTSQGVTGMQHDWNDTENNKRGIYARIGTHSERERERHDFYATDPEAIDLLLKYYQLPKTILEPACGMGHLSERLEALGHKVYSSDLIDRGYGQVKDFFAITELPENCNCIVTNPPYKFATEFVLHSLNLLKQGGGMRYVP
jgi:hypothetical protein